jgi:hypothetical protein
MVTTVAENGEIPPPMAVERRPVGLTRFIVTLARRPQRTLLLSLIGAAIGLIVAAPALFRMLPTLVTVVPPGYVALVNQQGILMSDFIVQTATETGKSFAETTETERSKVLREMIDEELLVQRGLMLDLPETTTEVRLALVTGVNLQVDASLLAQRPTDEELRTFYQMHRLDYATIGSMTPRDLVLHIDGYQNADRSTAQAETDAAEAVYQLRSGAAIDDVMEHFGLVDSGRVNDGEQLDSAAKLRLGDKLYQIASTLGDGEISDPVLDNDGVHVLVMGKRTVPQVADFGSVRQKVYEAYRSAQAKRAEEENLKFLRRDAQILLAPGQSE